MTLAILLKPFTVARQFSAPLYLGEHPVAEGFSVYWGPGYDINSYDLETVTSRSARRISSDSSRSRR